MTLQELRSEAAHWAGFVGSNEDPQFAAVIGMLLKDAHLYYGRKWLVPRRREQFAIASGTASVTLASRPYTRGVLTVSIDGRRVPVLDPYRLDSEYGDRNPADTGDVRFVEHDFYAAPTLLRFWPIPSKDIDVVAFYGYIPPELRRGDDEAWDGQFPEYHNLIALRAALQYVEKRLGEDSAEKLRDENPYGPLNAPNWLKRKLLEMEAEYDVQLARLVSRIPTADPSGRWYSPGYPRS